MYNTTRTEAYNYWLILPLYLVDGKNTLVPIDNIAYIAPSKAHDGAFVYLKSCELGIETSMSVARISEILTGLHDH